jgi:hypothetical protein
MSAIFKKLNLKDQASIVVINAPDSFEPQLASLSGVTVIRSKKEAKEVSFALAFVTKAAEVAEITSSIVPAAQGDVILWFAYPKKTSKKYSSEINRVQGWEALGQAGFEPVRQVAIDEDWSALRFRRVAYIQTMKRRNGMAISKQGKARTKP